MKGNQVSVQMRKFEYLMQKQHLHTIPQSVINYILKGSYDVWITKGNGDNKGGCDQLNGFEIDEDQEDCAANGTQNRFDLRRQLGTSEPIFAPNHKAIHCMALTVTKKMTAVT